ncbi:OLC1v1023014C1 [Oldenlandia corymbosa var. corymbosa]|nr:OLC1v1023014C1 [Oldenlandia corymbosa var. corymbosa]
MKNGIPLSEADRIPWLETLRDSLKGGIANGEFVILGCSALQPHYREILRSADQNYKPGSYVCKVKFVLLDAPAEVLAARLERRAAEGKHFMPAKLLQSQLDLLQIEESEGIIKVDATLEPSTIVNKIQDSIVKPQSH